MRRIGLALLLTGGMAAGVAMALPPGRVLDPPGDSLPRQSLRSEAAGGRQSFLVALGNAAFSSPAILGPAARAAGLSCNSCHTNGHRNPALFVPGQSTRPGTFDPGGPAFARADAVHPRGAVRVPSLRGARDSAPYGHDGRAPTLAEFTRFAITREFDGPEPPALILAALVAYMEEFAWLPAPRLDADGAVRDPSAAESRGAAAFVARCGACHQPALGFLDRQRHDVGTGGPIDTPALRGVRFNAPFLHDGSAATIAAAVVRHAGLADAWDADLAAYLDVIGDGEWPGVPVTFRSEMAELATYVEAIDGALARGEGDAAALVAETVAAELERLARRFPQGDPDAGRAEPVDYAGLTRLLRRTAAAARHGDGAEAAAVLVNYLAAAEAVAGRYSARLR